MMSRADPAFWFGRRVLVTGHTGFKGSWLCLLLDRLGAQVSGLALAPAEDGAFAAMRPEVPDGIIDIRDVEAVAALVRREQPDVVLHLAAQALVGVGHAEPMATWSTNVMGTLALLNAMEQAPPRAGVIVTSDKVYRPSLSGAPFLEDSPLGGIDPYSASKSAVEHAAFIWRPRLEVRGCRIGTARAGNVIGGGDQGADRLVPDIIRADRARTPVLLRHPESVRPWQYVIDVLSGYLLYAEALWHGDAPPSLNFGPADGADLKTVDLVTQFQHRLGSSAGWRQGTACFAETPVLRLNAGLAERTLGWRPITDAQHMFDQTAEWHEAEAAGANMAALGRRQIDQWMAA